MHWFHEIRRDQWRVLFAAQLGYVLDAMDVLLYSFALSAVKAEFQIGSAAAGAIAAVPMVTSALGGLVFGYLADRYGRARALAWSILCFSVLTALTASSRSIAQLILWRSLAGIGLGGEWAAGSVLVAETWPAEHRSKGIGLMQSGWALGYMAASLMAALVLPRWGWRPLFLLGILPAFFTWWIRRNIPESPEWRKERGSVTPLLRPPLLRRLTLLTTLCCCLLFGYWGLFTWIPTYLASPLAHGGAGLGIVKSSAWLFPMQVGAFFGYILFGLFAGRVGRRAAFLTFVLTTAALIPVYGLCGKSAGILLAMGPAIGFFGHGYFSSLGVIAAEMFPPESRATAQGFSYNAGRALSAIAPATVGALADRYGIGAALGFTSAFFVCGGLVMVVMTSNSPRSI
ncbi:Major facilitator superfamily MFS_1 [Candidatus Sulfopaludibacter sp. SbA3]|nr:Major facilitator superfamily MFS_1 [Candidatus Sulfopaludibacter sp. SbA3]